MKKRFLFLIFLVFWGVLSLKAQFPIPSYNIPVTHAVNFEESTNKPIVKEATKGKRKIKVIVRSEESGGSCEATVWIYSLDQMDILGPFTVSCEELLSVEIDERDWGVLVQSDNHVYADVWIEEELKYAVKTEESLTGNLLLSFCFPIRLYEYPILVILFTYILCFY